MKRGRGRTGRTRAEAVTYHENRMTRWELAGGWCEAAGLHHKDCPGRADPRGVTGVFVTHHVLPREKGGPDDVGNLLWVWNGLTGLGAGGCHGRVHTERREAKRLGLLK